MAAKVTEETLIEYKLSTGQFAAEVGVKAQSVRARFCHTGSYYGVVPRRMPNDRLLWPVDSKERLLNTPQKTRQRPTPPGKHGQLAESV